MPGRSYCHCHTADQPCRSLSVRCCCNGTSAGVQQLRMAMAELAGLYHVR